MFLLLYTPGIEVTAFLCMISCFCLIAATIALLFGTSDPTQRLEAYASPLFIQTIASSILFAIFMVLYSFLASQVNDAYAKHRINLAQHSYFITERISKNQLKLYERFSQNNTTEPTTTNNNNNNTSFQHPDLNKYEKESLNKNINHDEILLRSLNSSLELLATSSCVNPVEVFGITADQSLALGFLSGLASFCITIAATYIDTKQLMSE